MYTNRKMNFIAMLFALVLISNVGKCQTNEIQIRYIGNCGLHITDGESHVYTDFPYKSGAHHYAEYDESEIDDLKENAFYIFTHKHSDHYYKGKMRKILKSKHGKKYGKWNIAELERLEEHIPGFKIKAFKTKHRFSFAHYSYLITWHGKRIFLSGDTESADVIMGVKDIDWAFIPAWLVSRIQETKKPFEAKHIGIYHIGPRDDINIKGDRVLMLNKQGEIITIPYTKK